MSLLLSSLIPDLSVGVVHPDLVLGVQDSVIVFERAPAKRYDQHDLHHTTDLPRNNQFRPEQSDEVVAKESRSLSAVD